MQSYIFPCTIVEQQYHSTFRMRTKQRSLIEFLTLEGHYNPKKKVAVNGISSFWFSTFTKIQNSSMNQKAMLPIFWDAEGVIHTEYLSKEQKINSIRYRKVLSSLRYRKERFFSCIVTTLNRFATMKMSLKFTVISHRPYSPALTLQISGCY